MRLGGMYKNKMYKKQTKFNFERKKQRTRNRNNGQNEKKNSRQKPRAKNRDQRRNQPTKIRVYRSTKTKNLSSKYILGRGVREWRASGFAGE
jgi:hypothetical protein